jgi:hypothetical protein
MPPVILSASVRAHYFNFSIMMIFNFSHKYFKLIKHLRSLTYRIHISIAREIVREGNKGIKTINIPYIKGTIYVSVNNL